MAAPRTSYRPTRHFDSVDENTEGCARLCQLFLFLVIVAAVAMGLLSVFSCEFLIYLKPLDEASLEFDASNPSTFYTSGSSGSDGRTSYGSATELYSDPRWNWRPVDSNNNSTNSTGNGTTSSSGLIYLNYTEPVKAGLGIFRFKYNIHSEVCYWYEHDDPRSKALELRIAQWGSCLALGFAGVAMLFLFVEFCCCRFLCSRVIAHFAFFLGACSLPGVFLVFSHKECNLISNNAYACAIGEGAIYAGVMFMLLMASLCLSCMTPKATPLFQVVQKRERESEHDPCICGKCFPCCVRRSKEDIYEENPELLLADLPPETVEVPDKAGKGRGHIYKHYYDDQIGGITLQSQYAAASQRWLTCERNYQVMLDRFKEECADLQSDSALLANRSRNNNNNNKRNTSSNGISKKLDDYYDEQEEYEQEDECRASEIQFNADWRYLLTLEPTDIVDPELARLSLVLSTMRENSRQAKSIMERIEEDLEEHIRSPEDKINAALLEIQRNKKARYEAEAKRRLDLEAQKHLEDVTEKHANLNNNVNSDLDEETQILNSESGRRHTITAAEPLLQRTAIMSDDDGDPNIEARVQSASAPPRAQRSPPGASSEVFVSTIMPPATSDDIMFDEAEFMDAAAEPPIPAPKPNNTVSWMPFGWGDGQQDATDKKHS